MPSKESSQDRVTEEVLAYSYNLFAFPQGYFQDHTAKELKISEKARKELIRMQKEGERYRK